jgi:hypothetical protein
MDTFNIMDGIKSLLVAGSPVLIISGWISAHLTHAADKWMVLQSFLIALLLTIIASFMGWSGIPISDIWAWLFSGLTNGLVATLIYEYVPSVRSLLDFLRASSTHQLTQRITSKQGAA